MKTILISETSGFLHVTLNRPEVRNSFSPEMIGEMTDLFSQLKSRRDLRAVILRGEGKTFCAGADLTYMQEIVKYTPEQNLKDAQVLHGMFEAVFTCPIPVVAQVHGAAFGGALGLIAASDIVVSDEATQYCFSEVKLGLAPAVISDFILRKIPLGVANPWMLTGQVFSSAEALRMGLVHFVGSSESLPGQVEKYLQSFREAGPEAVRETKALIQKVPTLSRNEALKETSRVISERRASSEGQEGLCAYLEKRTAQWRLK